MPSLGTTSVDGLISGIDTTSIIEALAAVRRRPITLVESHQAEREEDLTAYQSLTAKLLAVQSYATSLSQPSAFASRSVTTTDDTAVIASATSGAAIGNYELTINHLAQTHKMASASISDVNADLGFAGDLRLNGQTITLKASDDLAALRDAINNAQVGVSATIVTISDTDHRLMLTSQQTGLENAIELVDANSSAFLQSLGLLNGTVATKNSITNGMASDYVSSQTSAVATTMGLTAAPAGTITIDGTAVSIDLSSDSLQTIATRINDAFALDPTVTASVTYEASEGYRLEITGTAAAPTLVDSNGVLQTLGVLEKGIANEIDVAQDAEIVLDGYTITRPSNSIDDAIEGLCLDLTRADPVEAITLTIAANVETMISSLQSLVTAYNTAMAEINDGQTYDSEAGTGGTFFGDITIMMMQSTLHSRISAPVTTLNSDLSLASQIGLSVDNDGLLSLNTTTLRKALADNPVGVMRLMTGDGQVTGDDVEFVSSGTDTVDSGAAGYAVNITQVATKACAQSAELASGITQTETLTIDGQYNVTLQAGQTLEQARDLLNSIFEGNGLGVTASVVDNRLQIESRFYGSQYQVRIKSTLDDGTGGTDLGGTTAGQEVASIGKDVAGTIGGQTATGWGQYLTGTAGGAKDVKLKVSAATTGDHGVVKIGKGIAARLADYVTQLNDANSGALTRATRAVSDEIEDMDEEIAKLTESVESYIEDLKSKYASLESLMAKNQTTLDYITAGLKSLASSSDDDD